ncbi:RNA 3'-terminal phosphate cyclase [Halomicrococcus gelatinilyticus]|uniref:RNA 3'-terminal phosphate cyclase n=1 Tax=Halomicrococcus gelatinilyticus TaxID=1702103 RepID=UPI002E157D9C
MLELDGSTGGGQLVRTALSLSALSGKPFRMEGVRANRPKPGLRPQHRTAVRAVAQACDATVEGDDVGSETLTFEPGTPTGGTVSVDIGTAGSVTLLFDALLPLATVLDEPLAVTARGGTEVKWSPPMAFYRRVKLPLLRRAGLAAAVDVARTGFYPAGGGEATLLLAPSSPSPLSLAERGEASGVRVYSTASTDLMDAEVAERQATTARERVEAAGHDVTGSQMTYVDTRSPGTSLVVRADYEHSVAGFDEYGERGTPAETVAADAVESFLGFHAGPGAVDEHLADQLLVFLGLAGGEMTVPAVTDHVETNRDLLAAFGYDVSLERSPGGVRLVRE